MLENPLVVHLVGGRGGTPPLPVPPDFEKDIINVMYDADESAVPQIIHNSIDGNLSKTVVLPYCVSSREGVGKFHHNYDPYTSSRFPLDPRYAQFNEPALYQDSYDQIMEDTFRTMEEVELPLTTLDAVVLDRGEVPGPDLLVLHAQGSQLDVLNGASRLLDTTILAVQGDVELHPFYEGEPLLGDMCQLLARYNFDLVDLRLYPTFLPITAKEGFRGKGYPLQGQVLFLKRPETVETRENGVQLNKLAFIATTFGQFQCAQQCFETTGFDIKNPSQNGGTHQQPRYLDFISRLADAVASLPQRTAPRFTDKQRSYTQSVARFQIDPPQPQPQSQSLLRKYVKAIPPLVSVIRFLRTLVKPLKALSRSAKKRRLEHSESTVEALFLEFGMKEQYLLAQRNRVHDSMILPWSISTFPQ